MSWLYSHEDGTVRFWDVSSAHMQHLYTLSTSHIFGEETVSSFEVASNLDTDYEWPPFRRVCTVIVIVVEYFISINCLLKILFGDWHHGNSKYLACINR